MSKRASVRAPPMTLFDLQALPSGRTTVVQAAIDRLAGSPAGERGAVFTRPAVVEFMLDLIGYTSDQDLPRLRLLEPSFGEGEFLLAAVSRLLTAFLRGGGDMRRAAEVLSPCLLGVLAT